MFWFGELALLFSLIHPRTVRQGCQSLVARLPVLAHASRVEFDAQTRGARERRIARGSRPLPCFGVAEVRVKLAQGSFLRSFQRRWSLRFARTSPACEYGQPTPDPRELSICGVEENRLPARQGSPGKREVLAKAPYRFRM